MSSSHLSRIETQWAVVREAHDSQISGNQAQSELIDIYGPSIKKYLLASMRDPDAAAEVFQEFALRLIRGDFRNADSHKGRFRSMIKTALYRLMIDYYRRTKKQRKLGSSQEIESLAENESDSTDESFTLAWRQSLLNETWNRLEQLQQQTERPYFSVLRARVDFPKLTTKQLHQNLSETDKSIPAESAFRVFIHRARKRFAAILLEQVIASMNDPTDEQVEVELIELGLHHFCKPAMKS